METGETGEVLSLLFQYQLPTYRYRYTTIDNYRVKNYVFMFYIINYNYKYHQQPMAPETKSVSKPMEGDSEEIVAVPFAMRCFLWR